MATDPKVLEQWKHHWFDEQDAAYLYGVLASVERDPARKAIYNRFVDVETRHAELWANLLLENGVRVPKAKPSFKAKVLTWIARRFGPDILLGALFREEGAEVKGYLALHRESDPGPAKDTAMTLAAESAEHADALGKLRGKGEGTEPWHTGGSSGFLRNVIYGFNDGLTANFGLVAGVLGATNLATQEHILLLSGVAGLVADALSMASSGYLAAKSELEVQEHEIAMEREEIRVMPELEQEELALIYEARGVDPDRARAMAADVMRDPVKALEEKISQELGIGEAHATPFTEGWVTGVATAIGAFLPVFPFVILDGMAAVWVAFAVAMVSHFGVGAARSLFTGRGIFRSGVDMFVVGLGVAVIGYFVGELIVKLL